MLTDYIDSALIIDDIEKEVEGLQSTLKDKDIYFTFIKPENVNDNTQCLRNRSVVFLDLFIYPHLSQTEPTSQISGIRDILEQLIGKDFGTYGIVLWTKDEEHREMFLKKVLADSERYSTPSFIVSLDKTRYLADNNYTTLFNDLEQKLRSNPVSQFLISWLHIVKNGANKTIQSIISLEKDPSLMEGNLQYLLYTIAKNYRGMNLGHITANNYPLDKDCYRAFNELLDYDVNVLAENLPLATSVLPDNLTTEGQPPQDTRVGLFADLSKVTYTSRIEHQGEERLFSVNAGDKYFCDMEQIVKMTEGNLILNNVDVSEKIKSLHESISQRKEELNSRIHLDTTQLDSATVLPGNVYEFSLAESLRKLFGYPKNSKFVVIEITPPCDFSNNKKVHSRCIVGFICEYSEKKEKCYNPQHYYQAIKKIRIEGYTKPQMIYFDFRNVMSVPDVDLCDPTKYKLIMRVKNKLFADILQKFSSHAARIGVSMIE